jgi:excinuclease UvrABC ATPase subunit
MGADARSTVGTATDANAVLRVLFNRLGKPYVASPKAFSFNVLSVRAGGRISIEKGAGKNEKRMSGSACHSSAGPALELRRGFQLKSL